MQLDGKVTMITGASQGLGAALARRFAEEGAAISICARGERDLRQVEEEIRGSGARVLAVPADVSVSSEVRHWFDRTIEELGRVDALVNNASLLGPRIPIERYPVEKWRDVLDVNLTGPFLCARMGIAALREAEGSLINVSSGVGNHGRPLWGAYSVSKNGLEALSQILAGELREDGVRVNVVNPGAMRTEMRAAAYPDEDPVSLPPPEQVTDVFVYLASDASRGVTGERFEAREFSAPAAGPAAGHQS